MRLGVLVTHPVQYLSPWFRHLADRVDLDVYYAHHQDARGQAEAGFGAEFEWDTPLLEGYKYQWLQNVARRPSLRRFGGLDTPEIESRIQEARFDAFLVLGWNRKCHVQAIRACHRHRVPVFVRGDSQLPTPRSALLRLFKQVAYRVLLPRAGHFLYVGKRNREYLLHYGVAERNMSFVPHFVDTEAFRARAAAAENNGEAAAIRQQLGAGPRDFLVLFVGKLIAKKRPFDFVDACRFLKATAGAASVHGVMVGDGPLRGELQAAVARHGVAVHFAGFQNQSSLPRYYAACDAIVLPSDGGETWGLVVNEAQACDRPALISDQVGCGPDLIDNELTGYTYPIGEVGTLAKRIVQIRSLLETRRVAVRSALRAKSDEYSLRRATDLLLEAIGSKRHP